ncbi:MAG TPA: DnaA/Hda family protein, partial [Parvularculaceae bacterium]|nr:DnaA/Hda family protein [Parvularculaceae bacterium]
WMSDRQLEKMGGDSVTLSTESHVKCETLRQRFIMLMKETWCEEVGPIRRLNVTTRSRLSAGAAKVEAMATKANGADVAPNFGLAKSGRVPFIGRQAVLDRVAGQKSAGVERRAIAVNELCSPLDERSTFDSFAIDDTNRMAQAAARQAAGEGGASEVVYIYGPSGVGKTHLLHAAGNFWRNSHGSEGCAYLAYHNITAGCSTAALTSGGLLALRQDLLSHRLLLIDDIHLLVGAPRSQTEILNFVSAALAGGKRVIIAGELSPAKLAEAGINSRLTDRLAGGVSVGIAQGGAALRADVIRKRLDAAASKCRLTPEAIGYVASHFANSTRETLGALNQLLLAYGDRDASVDLADAAAELRGRLGESRRAPSLDEAAKETAVVFSITEDELRGRGQPQRLARARHAFVYVGRHALRESFPRIARALGRDHTTAMSGYRRAEALLERDKKFQGAVNSIFAALGYPARQF